MRLKEIKPGMVIHCKNDEEKKALLEEAERLGYVWYNSKMKPTKIPTRDIYNIIHFYGANKQNGFTEDYKHITHSGKNEENVTEFSDLILPELTAEEAIKLHTEVCCGSCEECPLYNVDGYSDCEDLCINNPEKAVEILAQWKSEHEKKEPEIETVDICRIIEIQPDGRKRCVHEEYMGNIPIEEGKVRPSDRNIQKRCREILKRYCMEHEGEFIAVHEVVSRVKAV